MKNFGLVRKKLGAAWRSWTGIGMANSWAVVVISGCKLREFEEPRCREKQVDRRKLAVREKGAVWQQLPTEREAWAGQKHLQRVFWKRCSRMGLVIAMLWPLLVLREHPRFSSLCSEVDPGLPRASQPGTGHGVGADREGPAPFCPGLVGLSLPQAQGCPGEPGGSGLGSTGDSSFRLAGLWQRSLLEYV